MEGGDETVRTKRRCQFSSRVTCLNAELNMTRALKNNLLTKVSRPDWLLYAIPSVAFVLGVLLFLLVFRTQRRKETEAFRRVAALKAVMNTTSTGHTYTSQHPMGTQNKDSSKIQNSSKTQGNLTKQEAQSYENVTTIIYSNEDKVNYRVIQDEDYITPDAGKNQNTETKTQSTLNHLPILQIPMESRMRIWRRVFMLILASQH
ncbi:uncharacterized protein LOC124381868 isoform X5 [Silurus meridionalis]|uniref:uncharacterized protein LOC124381868 isoform X5 n=1 Tax=Silurus meridionalis TaxID=175797 RepID=UPI001EECE35F|nr:uncharacterized protein LOC124381868 isoform X5 [Silurus meridionalis]